MGETHYVYEIRNHHLVIEGRQSNVTQVPLKLLFITASPCCHSEHAVLINSDSHVHFPVNISMTKSLVPDEQQQQPEATCETISSLCLHKSRLPISTANIT